MAENIIQDPDKIRVRTDLFRFYSRKLKANMFTDCCLWGVVIKPVSNSLVLPCSDSYCHDQSYAEILVITTYVMLRFLFITITSVQ